MIAARVGNLLDSGAQTLVNTVNCVGVMGKGIALEFKKRFPEMHADYVRRCKVHAVRLGEPYVFPYLDRQRVINFPTKDHWRSSSKLSDIEDGLEYLVAHCREWGVTSIAVPPLGCGNGGLDWAVVGPVLYGYLLRLDIPVELYAPVGTPLSELSLEFLQGGTDPVGRRAYPLPAAAVALAEIVARIISSSAHWPVGRVTFQKIAYFATEAGLPTGLHFSKGDFGPFSPELKRMTTQLVNNGVLKEQRLGRMIAVVPGSGYQAAVQANKHALDEWEPLISRVTDLFLRIQGTGEAEIAATVKFAASEIERGMQPVTEAAIRQAVRLWKHNRIDDPSVADTIRNLNILGWLDAEYSADIGSELTVA